MDQQSAVSSTPPRAETPVDRMHVDLFVRVRASRRGHAHVIDRNIMGSLEFCNYSLSISSHDPQALRELARDLVDLAEQMEMLEAKLAAEAAGS